MVKWCCDGGVVVVVLCWWCCGGGVVVVVLWWCYGADVVVPWHDALFMSIIVQCLLVPDIRDLL